MFENIVLSGFADEIAASLDTQMQVLDQLQMRHIEMRGVEGRNFVEYSEAEAREIKKRLEDRGFSLSAVGSPIGKIRITDDFAPHLEKLRHALDITWNCSSTRWNWLTSWTLPISACSVSMARRKKYPVRKTQYPALGRRFPGGARSWNGWGSLRIMPPPTG